MPDAPAVSTETSFVDRLRFVESMGLPKIIQCGLAKHGHYHRERFVQKCAWSFHFYHYAGSITRGEDQYTFMKYWASLIPPGQEFEWRFPSDAHHYYIHFVCRPSPKRQHLLLIDCVAMAAQFQADLRFITAIHREQPLAGAARFYDMLWRLALPPNQSSSVIRLPSPVQVAISVIRNRLDTRIRIAELAGLCGVAAGHLNRLFRGAVGISVKEYLQRTRIDHAGHLLRESELPIRSVALSVGFEDLQAFNKFVRNRLKASPTAIREAARKAQQLGSRTSPGI